MKKRLFQIIFLLLVPLSALAIEPIVKDGLGAVSDESCRVAVVKIMSSRFDYLSFWDLPSRDTLKKPLNS